MQLSKQESQYIDSLVYHADEKLRLVSQNQLTLLS